MQISLTLELTPENLEKLKVFCEDTKAAPVKKSAAKTKAAPAEKPEPPKAKDESGKLPFEEAPAEKPEEKAPAKQISLTDVRAVALKLSKAGKSDLLKEIFAKFDATKLSEVPADRYEDLMKELADANA